INQKPLMRFIAHYFGFCFATLKLDYISLRILYLNSFPFVVFRLSGKRAAWMAAGPARQALFRGTMVLVILVCLVWLY
ncbi:MAG: hypothetical protein NTT76_06575, partial [Achromobacter xylosoxidans]|nr:hypothetical protein [Achromobacter xylosoxidans]